MATNKKKGTSRTRSTGGRRRKDTKGVALEKTELMPQGTGFETSGQVMGTQESGNTYLEGGSEDKSLEGKSNEEVRGERDVGSESESETREGPFGEGQPHIRRPDRGYGAHPGQSDAI